MKYILILFGFLVINACTVRPQTASDTENTIKPEKNEDGEWEIHVLDSQYDYFLNAIAKPMSMYSEDYLKNKNAFLVSEWNSYYFSGRYRNIIESAIEYNPQENYGMTFNYRLYQVFAYVQWKYGLKLNGLSGAEVR